MTSRSSRSGFTLIELLVSMTLLATLGALMVQLVRNSFDLYEQGDRRGDLYDRGLHVLNAVEDDLAAVAGIPDGRLVIGDASGTSGVEFLMRLVRSIPGGEENHPVLRRAGAEIGADQVYEGGDPGPTLRDKLAPPSGLMEVAFALIQEPEDPAGILTLYRGERAPILGPGSFFGSDAKFDEGWVRQNLTPVASGILGLWVLCFGQTSEDWDEESVLNARGRPVAAASLTTWDSTRGLLPAERFPLAVGPASLRDSRDDIFPKKVRIVLQVARPEVPEALLASRMSSEADQIDVNTTTRLPVEGDEQRYIKVGNEWMVIGTTGSGWAKVARGKRGSGANFTHPMSTKVFSGRLFRKTMELPVGRSVFGASR